jgi:beta-glucosidase/6-phospho-beta-glucosidase/beta-galactosidase
MEFTVGWFLDPFFRGDYPSSMRNDAKVGPVLPAFTDADKDALSLGIGFLAINYYTSYYIYESPSEPGNYAATSVRNGKTIGPVTGIEWQFTFPQGLDKLLTWIDKRYPSSSIWITELGCAAPKEPELPLHEIVKDDFRIDFLNQHLQVIMNTSVSIYAVLIWSLLDNWEWQYGYSTRFGVTAVDFNNGTLTRTIKSSGYWLRDYFTRHISSDPSVSSPSAKTSAATPLKPSVLIMMLLIILS